MGSSIKKEPLDANDADDLDLADFDEDFFSDKPRLTVKERLEKLKRRGICINQPGEARKVPTRKVAAVEFDDVEPIDDIDADASIVDDDNDGDEQLPHMMVTVTMKEGDETKVVPLEHIRRIRADENR